MRLPTLRRISQLSVFLIMFIIPIVNLYEIYAITGTFYAINIGGLGIADPSAILQSMFSVGQLTPSLLFAALFPLLLALLLGRVWCGWMCPYLLISDITFTIRKRALSIFGNHSKDEIPCPRTMSANLTRFGFLILGTGLAAAIGIPVLNYVNAPGVISAEAMLLVKEGFFSVEILFIALLIILEITLLPRFWCRLFCPTGSVISVFRTRFTMSVTNKVKSPKNPCCSENHCASVCPMGLAPYKEGSDSLCVNCGLCIDACENHRLHFHGFSSRV